MQLSVVLHVYLSLHARSLADIHCKPTSAHIQVKQCLYTYIGKMSLLVMFAVGRESWRWFGTRLTWYIWMMPWLCLPLVASTKVWLTTSMRYELLLYALGTLM